VTVKKLVIGARFPYSVVYTKVLSRALNNRLKKFGTLSFLGLRRALLISVTFRKS